MRFHLPVLATMLAVTGAAAMDHRHDDHMPRIGAQVLAGTSGIEPGVFAEWRLREAQLQLRPEVFVNEDGKIGAGGAIAWEPEFLRLPDHHALALGPRALFHNSDDSGWEIDLMAIWSWDFIPSPRGRHFLEIIGAVGVLEDREGPDDETEVGASAGIGYGFQF